MKNLQDLVWLDMEAAEAVEVDDLRLGSCDFGG
jgi:hypothetical protein